MARSEVYILLAVVSWRTIICTVYLLLEAPAWTAQMIRNLSPGNEP